MPSKRDVTLLWMGLASAALAAFLIQRGLSEVAGALLDEVELDLPGWLRFLLTYPQVIWGLPLLVLVAWAAMPRTRLRGVAACTLGLGMLALTLLPSLPFFKIAVTL